MPTEEERVPPPMGIVQAAEFRRRRRGRNIALVVVLSRWQRCSMRLPS